MPNNQVELIPAAELERAVVPYSKGQPVLFETGTGKNTKLALPVFTDRTLIKAFLEWNGVNAHRSKLRRFRDEKALLNILRLKHIEVNLNPVILEGGIVSSTVLEITNWDKQTAKNG